MMEPRGETVLFFRREGFFYPVTLMGTKPVRDEVEDHVRLNPETVKVTRPDGDVLWQETEH